MIDIFQVFGSAGTLLFAIAYLPQILHLIKEHNSKGISLGSWFIWLIACVLLLLYAVNVSDLIFTAFYAVNIAAIIIIIALIYKYKNS